MATRKDVMVYSSMIAAFCALAGGFCFDIGKTGTGSAFVAISIGAVFAAIIAYIEPSITSSTNNQPPYYP